MGSPYAVWSLMLSSIGQSLAPCVAIATQGAKKVRSTIAVRERKSALLARTTGVKLARAIDAHPHAESIFYGITAGVRDAIASVL